jgi:two-component system, cell cycle response regulator
MLIALVEPSRVGRIIMTSLLEKQGHVVVPFGDGGEALECIRRDAAIEVVVTSLEAPTVSGLELCWHARTLASKGRPLYVIAMSSSYDNDRLAIALDSGADDFISKPPSEQELTARLRAAERLLLVQQKLVRMAMLDPLTNLLNRRAFLDSATPALVLAEKLSAPLSLLMIDIDHFKRVNDTYGHHAGDEVIRKLAARLGEISTISGRLGGEEFAVVLEMTSEQEAVAIAEALRLEVAGWRFTQDEYGLSITTSIGVAQHKADEAIPDLLKRADVALYTAKNAGRNRVVSTSNLNVAPMDNDDLIWIDSDAMVLADSCHAA